MCPKPRCKAIYDDAIKLVHANKFSPAATCDLRLVEQAAPEWWERYRQRCAEYRFPSGKEKQLELAKTIGRDGFHLLTGISSEQAPPHLRSVPVVNILRQMWIQQFALEDERSLLPGEHLVDGGYQSGNGLLDSEQM